MRSIALVCAFVTFGVIVVACGSGSGSDQGPR
jgi:hypothetical protein